MIDFTEIIDPEKFEDFILELIKNKHKNRLVEVFKTGRGNDEGADILAKVLVYNEILEINETKKVIIECKHNAKSKRAVRKEDINILQSMTMHEADIYLLVTSTRIGSYHSKTIQRINETKNNEKAWCWDANYLESELLNNPDNDILFLRFFPKSYKHYIELKKIKEQKLELYKKDLINGDLHVNLNKVEQNDRKYVMKNIYLIARRNENDILLENILRDHSKRMGIQLMTTSDVEDEWIWSFSDNIKSGKYLENANAIFAIVTKENSKSPILWIEIQKAMSTGKLKAVFIDESIYSIMYFNKFPCVLLKGNVEKSISDFEDFYRNVFQEWGDTAHFCFWFSIEIIMSFYSR